VHDDDKGGDNDDENENENDDDRRLPRSSRDKSYLVGKRGYVGIFMNHGIHGKRGKKGSSSDCPLSSLSLWEDTAQPRRRLTRKGLSRQLEAESRKGINHCELGARSTIIIALRAPIPPPQ